MRAGGIFLLRRMVPRAERRAQSRAQRAKCGVMGRRLRKMLPLRRGRLQRAVRSKIISNQVKSRLPGRRRSPKKPLEHEFLLSCERGGEYLRTVCGFPPSPDGVPLWLRPMGCPVFCCGAGGRAHSAWRMAQGAWCIAQRRAAARLYCEAARLYGKMCLHFAKDFLHWH